MKKPVFTGAATAIVTPFLNDKIDLVAYDRLLEQQLSGGISAIVVSGTTGEASTMTVEEKCELLQHTVQYIHGRCKVIAGVGTNNTAVTVNLAQLAEQYGADALLAVTPYYNKCSQDGLVRHYYAIADATSLPLIVYNVPSRTGVNITPETCQVLSAHPNINGIKEASGNISQVARIRNLCADELYIWSGNDDQITATMALGGKGIISVLSNVYPKAVVKIAQACLNGDFSHSAALQAYYMPLIDALFSDVNPIPVKAALDALHLCSDELRLPLTRLDEKKREKLLLALHSCKEEF